MRCCLWKYVFDSNFLQTHSDLLCLTFCVTLRPLTPFQLKITAIKWQKSPTMSLNWNLSFRSFHGGLNLVLKEIQIRFRTFF